MTKELAITKHELSRRATLERTIRQGKGAFIAVGNALAEIRDRRLYRDTHKSFEAYCSDVWGWKRVHAYRLIRAAGIADEVKASPIGYRESHVRPLLRVPKEKLHQVIEAAAEVGATTAKDIEAVVEEVTAPELLDELGRPVPQELREDWNDALSVGKEIRAKGRSYKMVVDEYLDKGEKFKQKHALTDQMSKDIGDMISEMSRTIPYAICPWCNGEGRRCEKCHSRGWVSKIYWTQFVPAKFKKEKAAVNGTDPD